MQQQHTIVHRQLIGSFSRPLTLDVKLNSGCVYLSLYSFYIPSAFFFLARRSEGAHRVTVTISFLARSFSSLVIAAVVYCCSTVGLQMKDESLGVN